MAERVGFEPACKRKLKDLQRTGSDLKQRKSVKNHWTGFKRVSSFSSILSAVYPPAAPPHFSLIVTIRGMATRRAVDASLFRTHRSSVSNNFNGCRGTAKHWKVRQKQGDRG